MKNKHMLSLLQSGYTTVHVAFDQMAKPVAKAPPMPTAGGRPWQDGPGHFAEPDWPKRAPLSTYAYKTRDLNTKPGDKVVVERGGVLSIAEVVSVDPVPRIDVDAEFDYKWIVQRINLAAYHAEQEAEVQFADMLQNVERERQREELVASMTAHLQPGTQARALFDNAIAQFGAQAALGMQTPVHPTPQPATAPADENLGMQCR